VRIETAHAHHVLVLLVGQIAQDRATLLVRDRHKLLDVRDVPLPICFYIEQIKKQVCLQSNCDYISNSNLFRIKVPQVVLGYVRQLQEVALVLVPAGLHDHGRQFHNILDGLEPRHQV
jgi:hypothetical protein